MKTNSEPNQPFHRLAVATRDGDFVATYSSAGLSGLAFPASRTPRALKPAAHPVPPRVTQWHSRTQRAVTRVLAGQAPASLPPLDLSHGTAFQKEVWAALRQIPPGQTASYAEIARRIGRPSATRAVGGACGTNPIPLLVPCHRVLATNRQIGGFSGGLHWKKLLLEREGVSVG